jgi:hypothetical protein
MIVALVAFCVSIILTVDNLRVRMKRKQLAESVIQLTLDKLALQNELNFKNMSPGETEQFIKFLSDSRESAFSYIEDVQASIVKLRDAIDKKDEANISANVQKLLSFVPERKND